MLKPISFFLLLFFSVNLLAQDKAGYSYRDRLFFLCFLHQPDFDKFDISTRADPEDKKETAVVQWNISKDIVPLLKAYGQSSDSALSVIYNLIDLIGEYVLLDSLPDCDTVAIHTNMPDSVGDAMEFARPRARLKQTVDERLVQLTKLIYMPSIVSFIKTDKGIKSFFVEFSLSAAEHPIKYEQLSDYSMILAQVILDYALQRDCKLYSGIKIKITGSNNVLLYNRYIETERLAITKTIHLK